MGSWRAEAACAGMNPELFYPTAGGSYERPAAKAVCGLCPVQTECLLDGLSEEYGVWGGLVRAERRVLIRLLNTTRRAGRPPGWSHGASAWKTGKCRCVRCRDLFLARQRANEWAYRKRETG